MANFQYLNYQDIKSKIKELLNNPTKNKVTEQFPIGFSEFGLPIEHYTIGHGPKHIVVSASYHAAEIITSIFAVRLMEEIANDSNFPEEKYTIDFLPIINPEGYLITTSMQDLYLGSNTSEEEKIAKAKVYWSSYKEDTTIPAKVRKGELPESALREKKKYQALFDHINLYEYLKEYPLIKEKVLSIIRKNNYPIGVLAAWTSNASGIDLSQNVPFNPAIKNMQEHHPVYNHLAYSNTRKDIPGPVNCPCRDLMNFSFEKENLAMLNFFETLRSRPNEELIAYFNYHSVMGTIYQRTVKEDSMIDLYQINYENKVIENYLSSRIIRSKNAYDIMEGEDPYGYINEFFRLKYGINIQIELSKMGSNPIGPLADPKTFEEITVKPNLEAFKSFLRDYDFIKRFAEWIESLVKKIKQDYPDFTTESIYDLINKIARENPTIYTKLKLELNDLDNHNSHVISYFYTEIVERLMNNKKENRTVKETNNDPFSISFNSFIDSIVNELNENRKKPLTKEERTRLMDNLFRDYPELIANIKYNSLNNLPTKDWYNKLSQIVHNQIKMNNLLNKPKRKEFSPFDFPDMDILVNKDNPLPEDYETPELIEIDNPYYNPFIPGTKLTISSIVNKAFQWLKEDVKKQGYELWIDSGYRTREYQEIVLQNDIKEMGEAAYDKVALPGTSEHESGLAIDCGIVIDGKYFDELPEDAPITKWIH